MKRKILLIFFIIAFPFSVFFSFPDNANALPIKSLSFGGRILATIPCTSGGFLVVVGVPKPGVFLFQAGVSSLKAYFRLTPGPWALGDFVPGGVCVVGLIPVPVFGTIRAIGTSLF